VSWVLAFLGFAALIILHEAGHFAAAKAVGMRVERFALFFPPLAAKVRRGETEYAIGTIPLGGYVKITGMNPAEEIPPELAHRAYYRQAVWKRIVVIAAGPAVNIVLAFLILWVLFWANGIGEATQRIGDVEPRSPAAAVLQPGDRLLAVDGVRGSNRVLVEQVGRHGCAGEETNGCRAETPAQVTVLRDGRSMTFALTPVYDAEAKRMRVGFAFEVVARPLGPVEAAGTSVTTMWTVTTTTVDRIVRLFDPEARKELSGVVGSYEVTRQTVQIGLERTMEILALISLSLGVINLFPFLPLDGGHIFWAVAEKIRGKAIPFWVMERAGFVGFALVILLFFIGLQNDIGRLQDGSLEVQR
jgi:regulator of sigma E protease